MSFSFGTPTSAPASGLSSGFSFGANKPATPGFGLATTTQSTGLFGTPTTSTTGFGATSAFGAAAPAFGAATPAFGAPSAAPAFGATATPSFGATSTAPAFGATTTPAFGATTTPAFGATTTPAFGAATAAPAFGAASAPAFGSAAPSFGATTAAPSFGGGLGTGGLSFGAGTTTSTAGGLNFGAPATSAAAPGLGGLGGFGFGASTAASTGFNLLGSTSATSTTNSLFGAKLGTTSVTGIQPTASAAPSLGLGGVAPSAGGAANTTATGDGKSEPPKQTKLPSELCASVEAFKDFVKRQKAMSADIMRVSIKPLHQVSLSAEALQRAVWAGSTVVRRARAAAASLRARSAARAAAADLARHYTAGMELEPPPPPYVRELLGELEAQLAAVRSQVDAADKLMQADTRPLSQEEVVAGMTRLHGAMVALGTRLQAAHQALQAFRLAHTRPAVDSELEALLSASEPRKRSRLAPLAPLDPRRALGNVQQLAGPTPFSYFGSALSPLGAQRAPLAAPLAPLTDLSGGWGGGALSTLGGALGTLGGPMGGGLGAPRDTFRLQKPPGKRGKQ